MNTKVESKVKSFINDDKMFTSVDVSNAIKRDGTWISNREVSIFLKGYSLSTSDYSKTVISVGSGRKAYLYHPDGVDPSDYANTNARALTPTEAGVAAPTATAAGVVDLDDDTDDDDDYLSKTIYLGRRARVPGKFTRIIGLNPGDQVDPSRFQASVSSKLKVNKDGRVSVKRDSITDDDAVDQVSISIDNGMIAFTTS